MSIEKYWERFKEIENTFYRYQQDLDNIIDTVSSSIYQTVITKGKIANPTPYYNERMGNKANGKILQAPILSDDCLKYHYDSKHRLIMIEEYSLFLGRFQVTEIYLYNELTERLRMSSESLAVLSVFDNPFSNTRLSFAFAGRNGYIMEEFRYDRDILAEIKISRKNTNLDSKTEIHRFLYENQALIQIERICQNGYKELLYTTKKPNFKKIKEDTYNRLKHLITEHKGAFASFGIEGFLDQHPPCSACALQLKVSPVI